MKRSNKTLSMEYLNRLGFVCDDAERWIPHTPQEEDVMKNQEPRNYRTGVVDEAGCLPLSAIARALGVADGDYFDFVIPHAQISLTLGRLGITWRVTVDPGADVDVESLAVYTSICIWVLSHYGQANALGAFAWPAPESQGIAVGKFGDWLAAREHWTMDLEELLPRVQAAARQFWRDLPKADAGKVN